jgi:hypothetical protein
MAAPAPTPIIWLISALKLWFTPTHTRQRQRTLTDEKLRKNK